MATTASHSDRRPPELLTPDEVAGILRVTLRTVRRWGASGTLERIRIGGRLTRYTEASVARLIDPHNDASPAGEPGSVTSADDGSRYGAG